MTRDDLIAKVRKLIALSDSPNEHEAAAAAGRVSELLARYQIDRATVDAAADVEPCDQLARESSPPESRRVPAWRKALAAAIGEGLGLYVLTFRGGSYAHFDWFGPLSTVQTASYLFQSLAREIDRLAGRNARGLGTAFANSYRRGIVYTLRERLTSTREAAIRAAEQRSGSTALVVVRNSGKAAEQFARSLVSGIRNVHNPAPSDRDGWLAGRKDGREIDLGGARTALEVPRLALSAGGGK